MKRVFLFDFDGTLVDSMPTFTGMMSRILDENGIPWDAEVLRTVTPLGYRGAAEYFRELGIDLPIDVMIERMYELALEEYRTRIPLKAGVAETLRALAAAGADLNILTASPHAALDVVLERHGITPLFHEVWSSEDFGTTKSDPAIYEMAAKRLGCTVGEVVFVDDNLTAVRTAKAAGMRAVGIFDESSAERADEIRAVADRYVMEISELLAEQGVTA